MKTDEIRPDNKGPKNVAILLFISALLLAGFSYQDWLQHQGGLTDSQVDTFLATPNSQGGEPTTIEDFRDFEEDVQSNNGYLIRALGLTITTLSLLIGAPLLHRLNIKGAYLCVSGAIIGLFSGIYGSYLINTSAQLHLGDAMILTYEIWVYLCGSIMSLCLAVTALPLLNTRARLALRPRVDLVYGESE
ncbi:MAG TPA: hypothetical protein QF401_05395 [Candidatus Poseidoniaceae archaeon]|nr:hypothetical protein [Candidatus Poseidoniaceae archaeon]